MKDKVVFPIDSIPFTQVDWGQTKELVGRFCKANSENVLVKVTEYLPCHTHKYHSHTGQEEIIIVLSGKGQTETASGTMDLYPGYISFIPAGVKHATYNPYEDEVMRAIIIKTPPDDEPLEKQ